MRYAAKWYAWSSEPFFARKKRRSLCGLFKRRLQHMLDQPLQFFIRLGPDHQIFPREKRRHGVDAEGGAAAPVVVDGVFEFPAQQYVGGFIGRQIIVFGDFCQNVSLADVLDVDEVRPEERIGHLLRLALCLRPLCQFLGQPAVVGHVAFGVERQTFAVHVHFHALIARDDLWTSDVTFLGSFGMKRKLSEFDLQAVIFFQFLDTPGDEVTPGSNEI
jgi:hypothetical protein